VYFDINNISKFDKGVMITIIPSSLV